MAEPQWLTKARERIGFHETGTNRGIDEFIQLAHCGAPGDPWCAIFTNAMLESAGIAGTRSAAARSFESSSKFVKLDKAVAGAVTTMWRGSPASGQGHVGFHVGEEGDCELILGGNQDDQVEIARQPKDRITGHWWPKSSSAPTGTINPTPAGKFTGITATVFDDQENTAVAYSDVKDGWPDRPGVALPFRFHGARPQVRVTCNGKSIVAPIVDVGPWNTNDPYWERGARPQAESGTDTRGRKTNKAGIDLTPAAAKAIGLDGKGLVDWEFVIDAPKSAPAAASDRFDELRDHLQHVDLGPIIQALMPELERLFLQLLRTGAFAGLAATPAGPAVTIITAALGVLRHVINIEQARLGKTKET